MLKKKITVNSYDVGENGEIKVSSLMKYMQQLAVDDIADTGATYEKMRADDCVFVIIRFALKFFSQIRKYDELEMLTVNNRINGITFVREYLLYRGGVPVAQATTHWVLMSFLRRMPLRPSALRYDVSPANMDIQSLELLRKLELTPETAANKDEFKVNWSSLDENRHLNNTVYADLVFDHCGCEIGPVDTCRINFTGESLANDVLDIYSSPVPGGAEVFGVNRRTGKRCFESDIRFVK
ncbi:MAG: hypothetical protein J5760_03035 [Clostridia bacterium]|nr:hypothetical protein [Clostridia bacterium]